MKTVYQIQGTVVAHYTSKNRIVVQVPTFFLDADIQGIVDCEHAVKIATSIVCPVELCDEYTEANITATKVRWVSV